MDTEKLHDNQPPIPPPQYGNSINPYASWPFMGVNQQNLLADIERLRGLTERQSNLIDKWEMMSKHWQGLYEQRKLLTMACIISLIMSSACFLVVVGLLITINN